MLSLAIGKRGQNVRLAARLTGWDVNIVGAGGVLPKSAHPASTGSLVDSVTGQATDTLSPEEQQLLAEMRSEVSETEATVDPFEGSAAAQAEVTPEEPAAVEVTLIQPEPAAAEVEEVESSEDEVESKSEETTEEQTPQPDTGA